MGGIGGADKDFEGTGELLGDLVEAPLWEGKGGREEASWVGMVLGFRGKLRRGVPRAADRGRRWRLAMSLLVCVGCGRLEIRVLRK